MNNEPVIELRNVNIYHTRGSFRDPDLRRAHASDLVLSGINLTVSRGELVYLIGRVGSGKSSLLKTLYGEIPLIDGEGRVAGYDLCRLRKRDVPFLRRRLGIVFQDYKLLGDRDVYQNLYFVLRSTGWKDKARINMRIEQVLEMVGLTHKMYKMPFQLSGGEQQRLGIARALLNDPVMILADEPTGNLDPVTAEDIMSLFHSIAAQGCAVLIATHNISNIEQYPSRTLRFSGGVVEEIDIEAILGQ